MILLQILSSDTYMLPLIRLALKTIIPNQTITFIKKFINDFIKYTKQYYTYR